MVSCVSGCVRQVVRWSRLPYLCEGDLEQAFYWLSDAVFVLKPTADGGEAEQAPAGSCPAVSVPAEQDCS